MYDGCVISLGFSDRHHWELNMAMEFRLRLEDFIQGHHPHTPVVSSLPELGLECMAAQQCVDSTRSYPVVGSGLLLLSLESLFI